MAKSNGNIRWIASLVGLLTVFTGIVFGIIRPTLNDHENRIRAVEECMIEQRVDIKYIKAGIEDIQKHMVRKND